MIRRPILGIMLGLSAVLALSGVTSAFSGLANGSFESGTFGGGSFQTVTAPDSTTITGWKVATGDVDWIGSYWTAAGGTKSLDLNGCSAGTISQTFATTVNDTYKVTFALSGNPAGSPAVKTLTVSATGGTTAAYSFDTAAAGNTLADMKWTSQSYSYRATGASTTLTFMSTTSGCFGPALDNVVVTQTSAASAQTCKNGGWKTLVDTRDHHFKNQGDCVSFYASGGKNLADG